MIDRKYVLLAWTEFLKFSVHNFSALAGFSEVIQKEIAHHLVPNDTVRYGAE